VSAPTNHAGPLALPVAPHATVAVPASGRTAAAAAPSRRWPLAGFGAALCGVGMIVASGGFGMSEDERLLSDAERLAGVMSEQRHLLLPFLAVTTLGAMLLVVFAAGLRRHLAAQEPASSIVPDVAAGGLVLVAVMMLVGGGISTELWWGLGDLSLADADALGSMYHVVATMAWVWAGAGLTALAVAWAALRHGSASRWIGWVGLVLGTLVVLVSLAPVQYMSAMVGVVWLLVTSTGFTVAGRRG
jgi:hypothetical protein